MAETDPAAKTEEPTEKRLRDARRKGDTPASREPAGVAGLVALALVMGPLAAPAALDLARTFAAALAGIGRTGVGAGAPGVADVGAAAAPLLGGVAAALAPVLGALVGAALVGVAAQGGFVVAPTRLAPKWSKVSPVAGFKRLASPDALMEFGKNVLKVGAVGAVAGLVGWPALTGAWGRVGIEPMAMLGHTADAAARMIGVAAVAMVAVAVADVVWKRRRWRIKQRMSLREVRDEQKDSDGDPTLRARRDGIRRGRARQRMAAAVPGATVVITNPTHYAVALRYEAGRDAAPVCVAKGVERQAGRIRALAREAGVPLVENRPLARALHATVEVEAQVPPQHWQAVAEIIGYVNDLRVGRTRPPPAGAQLRAED